MDWLIGLIVRSFIFIFPAYVANSTPVLFTGKRAIDGGRAWRDGRPLLGKGKTWRGLIMGIVCGTLTGAAMALAIAPDMPAGIIYYAVFAFMLSAGALLGDIAKSFIKRRMGLKRGAMLPILDQIDFVLGAYLFTFWLFFPGWDVYVFVLLVTPGIHLATNVISYLLGHKSVPW